MSKNCPNCGSPIEPYKCKCDYCGTWYFDMSAFDLTDGKPCYVKFKTDYMGKKATLTTLAIPKLEAITSTTEYTDITNNYGTIIKRIPRTRVCEINMNFMCVEDCTNKSLFQIEMEE